MSGARETLSKAVVLACVTQAHRHGRDCQVVAFSTERQVMESGIITADTYGIQRLLDFLSHSFGGGTDVTGALKFAILSLGDLENRDDLMSSADILLVTDGEIPDPPVPTSVMESLDRLKLKKGVEVHGLLVGKSESKPLARLCTCTHNFLANHFGLVATGNFGPMPESRNKPSRRMSTALFAAKQSLYDKDEAMRPGKSEKKGEKDRTEDKDDGSGENSSSGIFTSAMDASFPEMVERSVNMVREAAKGLVKENQWNSQDLQKERKEATSWQHHKRLSTAVARVEDGLVERAEDARLVVLAMIASEHILLLGSPGTAKSVLGLRLAELCDGLFFQRLLTRFTMPEELFGPLSLRSLEQDEYRRVTAGFLPTADVAFLDEIFKANSAILNTLLTILNERKFDNAGIRESCPIRCVVGASNELPENDELVALFDRFLIRKEVKPVSDDGVLKLLSMKNPGKCTHTENGINHSSNGTASIMNLDDIINSLSVTADNVVMDEEACELMRDMRTFLREKLNVEISDRRLVKTTRLLKIVAASDGRQKVDMIDFLITQHCFWNRPEQRVAIREWLWENLTPLDRDGGTSVGQLRFLLNNLRQEIVEVLRKTNGEIDTSQGARAQDIAVIDSLADETRRVIDIIQEQHAQLARHLTLVSSDDFTWVDRDDVKAMQQLLLPRGDALWPGIQQLYENAYALSLAISNSTLSPSNEVRLAVIEALWDDDADAERPFTEDELEISMREAKAKYNLETFRRWKRAKKKAEKEK
jgi:MoxR-like ATPase